MLNIMARLRTEPGFLPAVVRETATVAARAGDVKGAILKNALDSSRADQWIWMRRWETMLAIPFLNSEDDDE